MRDMRMNNDRLNRNGISLKFLTIENWNFARKLRRLTILIIFFIFIKVISNNLIYHLILYLLYMDYLLSWIIFYLLYMDYFLQTNFLFYFYNYIYILQKLYIIEMPTM